MRIQLATKVKRGDGADPTIFEWMTIVVGVMALEGACVLSIWMFSVALPHLTRIMDGIPHKYLPFVFFLIPTVSLAVSLLGVALNIKGFVVVAPPTKSK